MIYQDLTELIGNTPLLRLKRISPKFDITAKLEYFNPLGSVKDRAALSMIEAAEKEGLIEKGSTIIEPTSGNTGVGLAFISALRGYRLILTMPESMSLERRKLLSALGAELVLTESTGGMSASIATAMELKKSIPGAFIPMQFENPANAEAHKSTANEIFGDTNGDIDAFIATIGTGGTVTGTGRYLKEKKKDIEVIGVEPAESAVISGGKAGSHGIQGIGAGFIPKVLDVSMLDSVLQVPTEEAYEMTRRLGREEGLLVGISSGAAMAAALRYAALPGNEAKRIVVLFPDTGERYLSSGVF